MASESSIITQVINQNASNYDGFNTQPGRKLFQELFWSLTLDVSLEFISLQDPVSTTYVGSEAIPFEITQEQKILFSRELGFDTNIELKLREILSRILFPKVKTESGYKTFDLRKDPMEPVLVGLLCLIIHFSKKQKPAYDYNFWEFKKAANSVSSWLFLPSLDEAKIARELFTLGGTGLRFTNTLFRLPYKAYFQKLEERIRKFRESKPEEFAQRIQKNYEHPNNIPIQSERIIRHSGESKSILERSRLVLQSIALCEEMEDINEVHHILSKTKVVLQELSAESKDLTEEIKKKQSSINELRRDVELLKEKSGNANSLLILRELLVMLYEPILIECGTIDDYKISLETKEKPIFKLRNWLNDETIEFIGEIGEIISITLPHPDYELDVRVHLANNMPKFKGFRIQKKGLKTKGTTILPAIVEPI